MIKAIELSDYQFTLQDVGIIKKEKLLEKLTIEQRVFLQASQSYMLYPIDSFIYESIKLLKGFKYMDKVADFHESNGISFSSDVYKQKCQNINVELDLLDRKVYSTVWEIKKAISKYVEVNEIDVPSLNEILKVFNTKHLSITNILVNIHKDEMTLPNVEYVASVYLPIDYVKYHGIHNFKYKIIPQQYRKYVGTSKMNTIGNIGTHYIFPIKYKSEDKNDVKDFITDMLYEISVVDKNGLSIHYID